MIIQAQWLLANIIMRLYEFDDSNFGKDDKDYPIPGLWIKHSDDNTKEVELSLDKFAEIISASVAAIRSQNAIDQARGYADWGYSDDLGIDLQHITSTEHVVECIENELYTALKKTESRRKIADIFQRIVDDPAWLRFIINLESVLRKYVEILVRDLQNAWAMQPLRTPRPVPKLPSGRTEYSADADSFIDKMKNMSENIAYNQKTMPKLSVILAAAEEMRTLISDYMKLIIDPCLKKLSIESPYIISVFNKYNIRYILNDYYSGMFGEQVLNGLAELIDHARSTLK